MSNQRPIDIPSPEQRQSNRALKFIAVGLCAATLMMVAVCGTGGYLFYAWTTPTRPAESLSLFRSKHVTNLTRTGAAPQPFTTPRLIAGTWMEFPSDGRLLFGYFRTPVGDAQRPYPVVVMCHGGFSLGMEDIQTADSFIAAGYAVFAPALRAENDNDGDFEMCFGEVDDVVAAVEFVAGIPETDPDQVFLAGHSIGGVNALLAAEISNVPRAVFSCGAMLSLELISRTVASDEDVPYDWNDETEQIVRSPLSFVKDLNCPALLAYGSQEQFALKHAHSMRSYGGRYGKEIAVIDIEAADHFTAWPKSLVHAIDFFVKQSDIDRPAVNIAGYSDDHDVPDMILRSKLFPKDSVTVAATGRKKDTVNSGSFNASLDLTDWTAIVDPGPAPVDWRRFVYQNSKRGRAEDLRVFRGNSRWATSRNLASNFQIISTDGEVRYRFSNAMPTAIPGTKSASSQIAGVALDGQHFAVATNVILQDGTTKRSITIHRSNDGQLIETISGYNQCEFLSDSAVLAWSYSAKDFKLLRLRGQKNPYGSGNYPPEIPARQMVLVNFVAGKRSDVIDASFGTTFRATPGGKHVVAIVPTTDGSRVEVRSTTDGTVTYSIVTKAVVKATDLAINNDSTRLAMIGHGEVAVFDMQSGKCTMECKVRDDLHSLHWIDQDRFLMLGAQLVVDPSDGRALSVVDHERSSVRRINLPEPQDAHFHGDWFLTYSGGQVGTFNMTHSSLLHLLSYNTRPTKATVTIKTRGSHQAAKHIQSMIHSTHQWFVQNDRLPDKIETGDDCVVAFRLDRPNKLDFNRNATPPTLTLFGKPLPGNLEPSGLRDGVLRGRYEGVSTVTADVLLRETDFQTRATKHQRIWTEEKKSSSKLNTVELAVPILPQFDATCLSEAIPSFEYPNIDRYGRTPWKFEYGPAAFNTVGFASLPRGQVNDQEVEPAQQLTRTFDRGWFDDFHAQVRGEEIRKSSDEPVATKDGKRWKLTMLNSFNWKSGPPRRVHPTGKVLGAKFVDFGHGPEMLTIITGENDKTRSRSRFEPFQELHVWRIDSSGDRQTVAIPALRNSSVGSYHIGYAESGRWMAVSPQVILFGNETRASMEVKPMMATVPQDIRGATMAADGKTLLVKQRKALTSVNVSTLWDRQTWPVNLLSLPNKRMIDAVTSDCQMLKGTHDAIAWTTGSNSRGKAIRRFDYVTGETKWQVPVKDCQFLYVSSDGSRVFSSMFQELRVLDSDTGDVIDVHTLPSGQVVTINDKWFALRTKDQFVFSDIDTIEHQFSFSLVTDGQRTDQVVSSSDGRRLAFFGTGATMSLQIWAITAKPSQ